MEKLITLIIPVYNVEDYLEECLHSVKEQTYSNLEIIVIDDGSTDQSGTICDRYAAKDPRIEVFHTENNGLSAARNFGLEKATGDWIGFVDSDDWIEPDMYAKMLAAVEHSGADICVCGFYNENQEKRTARPSVPAERLLHGKEEQINAFLVEDIIQTSTWNKLYRRVLLKNVQFPVGRNYEGIAFTVHMIEKAASIICIPDCLYHYRMRPGSIVHTHTLNNECDRYFALREAYDKLITKYPQYRQKVHHIYISSAWSVWRNYANAEDYEKLKNSAQIQLIVAFARCNRSEVLRGPYTIKEKIKIILECSTCPLLFKTLHIWKVITRKH